MPFLPLSSFALPLGQTYGRRRGTESLFNFGALQTLDHFDIIILQNVEYALKTKVGQCFPNYLSRLHKFFTISIAVDQVLPLLPEPTILDLLFKTSIYVVVNVLYFSIYGLPCPPLTRIQIELYPLFIQVILETNFQQNPIF